MVDLGLGGGTAGVAAGAGEPVTVFLSDEGLDGEQWSGPFDGSRKALVAGSPACAGGSDFVALVTEAGNGSADRRRARAREGHKVTEVCRFLCELRKD